MSLRSLANKGFALSLSNSCSKHSNRASSYANRAISSLGSARSKRDVNQKLDCLIEGMSNLSNAVKEISDSVTPVAKMNCFSFAIICYLLIDSFFFPFPCTFGGLHCGGVPRLLVFPVGSHHMHNPGRLVFGHRCLLLLLLTVR